MEITQIKDRGSRKPSTDWAEIREALDLLEIGETISINGLTIAQATQWYGRTYIMFKKLGKKFKTYADVNVIYLTRIS